jgi:hypothetical protein
MINIRKRYYLSGICLLLFCTGLVYPQRKVLETDIKVARPDTPGLQNEINIVRPGLSGTWKLNFLKSGFSDATEKEIAENSLLVLIDQKAGEIAVSVRARHKAGEEEVLADFTLYTDGRVSEISGGYGSQEAIAEWIDNKLRISSFSGSHGRRTILEIFEFAMSADGKTLTGTRGRARSSAGGNNARPADEITAPSLVLDRISSGATARAAKTF